MLFFHTDAVDTSAFPSACVHNKKACQACAPLHCLSQGAESAHPLMLTSDAYFWHAVAEGGAYGEAEAGGNSFSYWFLAVVFAGTAALSAIAPNIVGTSHT